LPVGEIMVSKKILICILAILVNIGLAGAATLNVGQGQKYITIQSAIDAANPGDTVSVGEGVYVENVLIKKNDITLIGVNKEKTIIEGKNTGIRIDESKNIIISGFTVRNSRGSAKEDAGVTLFKSNGNTISNLIVSGNSAGISIYKDSNNNIISGNDIKSNAGQDAKGIFIYASNDNKILNNNIQENPFGLYADSANSNQIYYNNFIGNKNQAYDNGDKNAWDDGKNGNYWSEFKGTGTYNITLGGGKARDNYPRSGPVLIKVETSPAQKSTPGFSGLMVVTLIIGVGVLRSRKKI
jgi:parallel beta-helix repeat protein